MSNTETITIEAILARDNMCSAFAAVKRNQGAPGVDAKNIEQTGEHLRRHWATIRNELLAGRYQPGAVRAVEIPKPQGGTRLLGIPNVQDRLIQQAMNQVLTAALDPSMSEHSYGFRPNRSTHDAVDAARRYVREGKKWVVDIDLKQFFDQVNHDRLMSRLSRQIGDKRVLALIGRYLRAPMRQANGQQQKRRRGTPQGGPLSPLLANLYLDPLDRELERRSIAFVRYADDVALFTSSERAAKRLLDSVKGWLREQLDLDTNDEKSGTGLCGDSQLLGFCIHETGDVSIAGKALLRLKVRVRELWEARQSLTTRQLQTQWQRFVDGWWNYFRYANWQRDLHKLSGWIRRHMRKCFWQRWHNRAGRRNALHKLGITGRRLNVAGCRLGAWAMSTHVVVNQALKTATLNRFGLTLPWVLAGRL